MTADEVTRAKAVQTVVKAFADPAFTIPPPLRAAKVAIVTTAGLHAPGQANFERGDESFRIFDPSERRLTMGHVSFNFDRTGFVWDLNVVYPIDRLHELAAEGIIGSVAPHMLSFMGGQNETMTTLRLDTGKAAAKLLRDDGVDVVLLTGVCPFCTRTLGTLAHVFEAEGLATVALASIRNLVERLQPPRALYCEFPLGRPLGKPNDPAFQRRVLLAAFAMLDHREGPVLADFPETVSAETEPLACTIPPRENHGLHPAVDEAQSLRAAYDRGRARAPQTAVGKVTGPDGIPDVVAAFVRIADGVAISDSGLPGDVRDAALDVRAYYEEAAVALAGHVPAARAAEQWLYRETETGRVLRAAQRRLNSAGLAEVPVIVPRGQE